MKPNPDEIYESWVHRAKMFEHGAALQRIAQGEDPEKVMEEMSRRLMQKMLNPIYGIIRDQSITPYDPEESKKEYYEKYLKNNKLVADHVVGNIDDID